MEKANGSVIKEKSEIILKKKETVKYEGLKDSLNEYNRQQNIEESEKEKKKE
jgi:hypothetical protein